MAAFLSFELGPVRGFCLYNLLLGQGGDDTCCSPQASVSPLEVHLHPLDRPIVPMTRNAKGVRREVPGWGEDPMGPSEMYAKVFAQRKGGATFRTAVWKLDRRWRGKADKRLRWSTLLPSAKISLEGFDSFGNLFGPPTGVL